MCSGGLEAWGGSCPGGWVSAGLGSTCAVLCGSRIREGLARYRGYSPILQGLRSAKDVRNKCVLTRLNARAVHLEPREGQQRARTHRRPLPPRVRHPNAGGHHLGSLRLCDLPPLRWPVLLHLGHVRPVETLRKRHGAAAHGVRWLLEAHRDSIRVDEFHKHWDISGIEGHLYRSSDGTND